MTNLPAPVLTVARSSDAAVASNGPQPATIGRAENGFEPDEMAVFKSSSTTVQTDPIAVVPRLQYCSANANGPNPLSIRARKDAIQPLLDVVHFVPALAVIRPEDASTLIPRTHAVAQTRRPSDVPEIEVMISASG
jgi:hypothetical protein